MSTKTLVVMVMAATAATAGCGYYVPRTVPVVTGVYQDGGGKLVVERCRLLGGDMEWRPFDCERAPLGPAPAAAPAVPVEVHQ